MRPDFLKAQFTAFYCVFWPIPAVLPDSEHLLNKASDGSGSLGLQEHYLRLWVDGLEGAEVPHLLALHADREERVASTYVSFYILLCSIKILEANTVIAVSQYPHQVQIWPARISSQIQWDQTP